MDTLKGILQKSYLFLGALSIFLSVLVGILGAILTFISRTFLIEVLKSIASPVMAYLLGANEATEKVAYLIMLIRFAPFVAALIMLIASVLVSFVVVLPDLLSSYCLASGSDWLPVVMSISIIKNIVLFPIGTILSVLSIIYLVGYFLGYTPRRT